MTVFRKWTYRPQWEKILANYKFDKGFISRIHSLKFSGLNNYKQKTQCFQEWTSEMCRWKMHPVFRICIPKESAN
jgi:hypothetical protein